MFKCCGQKNLVWSWCGPLNTVVQHRMSKHYYGGTLIPRTVFESKSVQNTGSGPRNPRCGLARETLEPRATQVWPLQMKTEHTARWLLVGLGGGWVVEITSGRWRYWVTSTKWSRSLLILEMAPPTVKGFSCVFCWESAFIAKNLVYESLHLSQIHLFSFQWMVG